ncbi:rCG37780 [Rattus norvegicus]|uniref:RCG37780 n=1 Tax=Rattus norvegicus TaxID=10116 RepID=A6JF21_RAT|nr:rCG37780 [Rattus norvegicus]
MWSSQLPLRHHVYLRATHHAPRHDDNGLNF